MPSRELTSPIEQGEEAILKKLKKALRADGDFPVRARVITELRILASKPNTPVNSIAEMILKEPALGTRVLHLVNSAFYQRSRPITTISQAIIHMGMLALCDLCAGLVLLQRFRPLAKRGGIFAENLKKSILVSLLASKLASHSKDMELAEHAYLAGSFYCLGSLLLAFYFPQVYEAASRRAIARGQTITQSITEILGVQQLELTEAILDSLHIPDFYRSALVDSYLPLEDSKAKSTKISLGHTVAVAARLAEAIIDRPILDEVQQCMSTLSSVSAFPTEVLDEIMGDLREDFDQHCLMIDMAFLNLPEFMSAFSLEASTEEEDKDTLDSSQSPFAATVEEIRTSLANGEPLSTIITTAMEGLVYSLRFDRALLLIHDRTRACLLGKMALGAPYKNDIRLLKRPLFDHKSKGPDIAAFRQGIPQIYGMPLFEDGWPFGAVPIGSGEHCYGVIYGDKIKKSDVENHPLDNSGQAALSVLTELLDKAVKESR